MNTPSARSARIKPTVQEPIEQRHDASSAAVGEGDRPDRPAGERALAGPHDRPRVAQQVKDRLDPAGLEQVRDRGGQLERPRGGRGKGRPPRGSGPERRRPGPGQRPDERSKRRPGARASRPRRPGPCSGGAPARASATASRARPDGRTGRVARKRFGRRARAARPTSPSSRRRKRCPPSRRRTRSRQASAIWLSADRGAARFSLRLEANDRGLFCREASP